MTSFLLIRHGETAHTGRTLSGRLSGVVLNERGKRQAAELPARVRNFAPQMVCSSPLERCRDTAAPIAEAFGVQLKILPGLTELDYGDWTGRCPTELEDDRYWRDYNRHRSTYRIPAGELLAEAQLRMLQTLETLQREVSGARIVVVGHSDPIRATLAYLLGLHLDLINRLSVDPASLNLITLGPGEARVHCINSSGSM